MKYCVCTKIENYSILEQLNVDYIELAGADVAKMTEEEFLKAKETITNGKVKCCGFNTALLPEIVFCGNGFDIEKAKDYAELICKRGHDLGIGAIGIGSPNSRCYTKDFDIDIAWQQAEEFIKEYAKIAQKYNIIIMYESLNDVCCSFGYSMKEAEEFVKKIAMPNVKIVFDAYHMFVQKETLEDLMPILPYINHVHVSECTSIERPYLSQASYEFLKSALTPVLKTGYDKTISLECFVGDVYDGVKKSLEILKQIVSEI